MKDYSREEKDFLEGVWSKVRYLEYVKEEQEKIKQNSRKLAAAKMKLAAMLAVAVIMISVPIIMLNGLELSTFLGVGLLLLGAGAVYEYYSEKQDDRRATYGNKH